MSVVTVILLKLFLCFLLITIVTGWVGLTETKIGEYFFAVMASTAIVLFTATLCSSIWFF